MAMSVQHNIKKCCREENHSITLFRHPKNGTHDGGGCTTVQVNAQEIWEVIVTPFQAQLIYPFAFGVVRCIDSSPDG